MMKNKKNIEAENYSSDLLDTMLDAITPEMQKNINRKMMLAAKIYDAMKAKGWNQTRLSREMGKRPSEISKWLSGTHSFTSDTLWAIGDMLGIELLPVQEAQEVVEVKYVPIAIKAGVEEKRSAKAYSDFDNSLFLHSEAASFVNEYSAKINIRPTKSR